MTNSNFCFFHDPTKAKERASARRAGGIERSRRAAVFPPDTPDRPLRSTAEVADLLTDMINKLLKGELDAKIGSAVGNLINVRTQVLKRSETEDIFAALNGVVPDDPESDEDEEEEEEDEEP
jgi:hypothetical protein